MRVLLIWPSALNEVLGWGSLGAVAEPLALEYLAAALTAHGHEPRILDLRLHPHELASMLEDFRPALVGVTAFSMHVRRALAICAESKALLPECRTVVGGHHATFMPEDFFVDTVDWVVCGEGCSAIQAIARAVEQEVDPGPEPGVWARDSSGQFQRPIAPLGSSVASLDAMPRPRRDLVVEDRARYFIDWMRPVALLRTTLGCPYRCTFCSIWKAVDGRYLMRDIDAVVDELAALEEEWVFLIDDEAFINRRRMLELAAAIRARGINKRYFTYCRIDTLVKNQEAVRAWREIGLERLFVGIDAIDPEHLDEYNKRCEVNQIEDGLALAEEIGVELFAQLVVHTNATREDFRRLRRFVEHHRIRYPSFTVLTPLPGTELLPDFSKVNVMLPNGRPNWDLFDCQNAVVATALTADEFRFEYRNLYHVFKGAYAQYREHNFLLDDHSARGGMYSDGLRATL